MTQLQMLFRAPPPAMAVLDGCAKPPGNPPTTQAAAAYCRFKMRATAATFPFGIAQQVVYRSKETA